MTREKEPRESILSRPIVKSLGQSYEEADNSAPEITDLHCRKDEHTLDAFAYAMQQVHRAQRAKEIGEGGEETPEEEAERHAAFEREGACPGMIVFSPEAFARMIVPGATDRIMFMDAELADSLRYYPPELEKTMLEELRWEADTKIVNHFHEHVWLKTLFDADGKRMGITECCLVEDPCGHHRQSDCDLDLARAHLLRTLEVKRCKDIMRNAPWVGFIDDPDSFVPPSERAMKLARAWYTEALPIREKGRK